MSRYKMVLAADSQHTGRLYTREAFAPERSEAFDRAKVMAGNDAEFFSRGPLGDREIGYVGAAGRVYIYELPGTEPGE